MIEKKVVSEFGKVITGNTPSTLNKDYWNGNFCWITPTDLSSQKYYIKSERQLTPLGLKNARILPSGTLLVTCIASIGKNGILKTKGACNQQINAIIPNNNYDVEYLYYLFNLNKNYLLSNAGITATPLISKTEFEKFEFSVEVDKKYQKIIAGALSDVDNLIENLEKLIEKKKQIKLGTMQELLTGKKRLAGFTKEWELIPVNKIGKIYNGLTGKTKNDFGWGNSKYVTFLNVLNNRILKTNIFANVNINESQNFIKYGDILFNTSSETPEEVALCSTLNNETNENVAVNSFCFGFRIFDTKKYYPLFIVDYFRSNNGRKQILEIAQGSTRYNLSKDYFLNLEIPLPEYNEQKMISDTITDMENEIQDLEQQLDKYKFIKQGMIEQLLTGKIRLA